MTETVRLLLVDDQRLMRDGLRTLLDIEPGMTLSEKASIL